MVAHISAIKRIISQNPNSPPSGSAPNKLDHSSSTSMLLLRGKWSRLDWSRSSALWWLVSHFKSGQKTSLSLSLSFAKDTRLKKKGSGATRKKGSDKTFCFLLSAFCFLLFAFCFLLLFMNTGTQEFFWEGLLRKIIRLQKTLAFLLVSQGKSRWIMRCTRL